MGRARHTVTLLAAAGATVLVTALQVPAHAGAPDLIAQLDPFPSTTYAVGDTADTWLTIDNQGDADSGPTTVTVTATNGTLGIDTSSAGDFSCTADSNTTATCTSPAVGVADIRYLDVSLTSAPLSGTATSEPVTVAAHIDDAGDADPTNNDATAGFTARTGAPVSFVYQVRYDPDRSSGAAADPSITAVDVTMTAADGSSVAGESVDVYTRPTGSAEDWAYHGSAQQGTGNALDRRVFLYSAQPSSAGLDLRLVHTATLALAGADITYVLHPRPTAVHESAATLSTRYGGSAALSGTLTYADDGKAAAFAGLITLQQRAAGTTQWKQVSQTSIDDVGHFDARISPPRNSQFRWVYSGPFLGAGPSVGAPIAVTVHQAIATTLSPVALPPGGTATLTTAVRPGVGGTTVTLQRKTSSGWSTVGSKHLTTSSKQTWTFRPTSVGSPTYRIIKGATSTLANGTGAPVTLTVTRKGKGSSTSYAFESTYNGHPASWNPCKVIHYRVNLKRSPAHGLADVKEAFRRVTLAGGLRFHYDGTTAEVPQAYATGQHTPMLVGWRPSSAVQEFQFGAVGLGGYTSTYRNGHEAITHGYVILDSDFRPVAGFGRGTTWGQLMMHEIGHAVGLNHSNGAYQIMRPIMDNGLYASMYGAGDLTGLRKLGKSQGCF